MKESAPVTTNPWVTRRPASLPTPTPSPPAPCPLTGPGTPQPGIDQPARGALPLVTRPERPVLWVLGAHGGAGESLLSSLQEGWMAAGHSWPAESSAPVVLTARTGFEGLTRAQAVLTQWASGAVGDPRLLGLILLADAPGRRPKALRDLGRIVGGGAPRVWEVPWVEAWRLGQGLAHDRLPRQARRMIDDLSRLVSDRTTIPHHIPHHTEECAHEHL